MDDRIRQLQTGKTVVATMRMINAVLIDHDLITYAEDHRLAVRIDRQTDWGNQFVMSSEASRDLVCDRYENYLHANPALMARIPSLKGKCLMCWCHPLRCHGDTLAALANQLAE